MGRVSSSSKSLPLSHESAFVWKKSWLIPLFGVLLVVSIVIATALGAVTIPLHTTTRLLTHGLFQLPIDGDERTLATIVYLIRLPRVLAAALVGASLALAGTMMQGLFRNPLADAGLIGVSSGGALGGALAISSGFAMGSSFLLPCATFAGALISGFGVYLFAARQGGTMDRAALGRRQPQLLAQRDCLPRLRHVAVGVGSTHVIKRDWR